MIKRLKVKAKMTGKELAALLHRSRLKWNNGSVIKNEPGGTYSYCMIGQIARHAGVSNETLKELGEGVAPSIIPEHNDKHASKEECVKDFCSIEGDIPIKEWIDDMLMRQKERGRE
jgi:hypothetical protein